MKVAILLFASTVFAETFEVASVRVHSGDLSAIFQYKPSGPRVVYGGFGLLSLIMEAYDVDRDRVTFTSLPSEADSTYYDIAAKAEGDTPRSRAEFRRMLQSLLADRFRLKVHWEGRERPVYALIPGKGGPSLRATPPDVEPRYHGGVNGSNQTIDARAVTMPELAVELQSRFGLDRPVVDRTALPGAYDIKLEATPQGRLLRDPDAGGVNVFTAVQEQLGLKLEPQKATIQVLVIDRVEKPSEN